MTVILESVFFAVVIFALGFGFACFAEDMESMSVRCACGRRELRGAICAPRERGRLARELTAACPWCRDQVPTHLPAAHPAPRTYLGDHDGE